MIPVVIPARGGSKGIRRKNLVQICGKPLLAWSIEQANASLVDEVCVATDDDEIALLADSLGAHVFRRSEQSASDTAPTEMVLLEVVRARYVDAEYVVFLQATSPMRRPADIEGAIVAARHAGADSVFSARVIDGYTWEWRNGHVIPKYSRRYRRQEDTAERLEENGSIYVFRPSILLQHDNRLGGTVAAYRMHPMDSFQIDEPDDIPLIESLMRLRGYAD